MIDINLLKGIIVSKGLSIKNVADYLNIAPETMYRKMNKGVFDSDEIYKLIQLLDIKDPMPVFFTNLVSCEDTKTEVVK